MVRWTQYANRRRLVDDDVLKEWFSKKGIDSFEIFVSWCHANALLIPTDHDREKVIRLLSTKEIVAPTNVQPLADSQPNETLPEGLAVNDEGYVVPKVAVKKKKPPHRRQPRKSSRSKKGEKK